MNGKLIDLIKILIKQEERITAKQLSAIMKISERSIKNYISEINYFEPELIDGNRNGYWIDKARGGNVLLKQDNCLPETSEERGRYIISELLKRDGEKVREVDIYDISEQLFVSCETVKKDMNKVRRKLEEYELYVNTEGSCITIEGKERNKRRLLSRILYEEFNRNILSLDIVQKAFSDYDLKRLKEIVSGQCRLYHYFVNDYAMLSLILDIVISMERIKKNCTFCTHLPDKRIFGKRERELSECIINQLEPVYDIIYSLPEREELTGILTSHFIKADFEGLNRAELEKVLGDDNYKVVCQLLDYLKENYLIDVEEADFFIKFALHISHLLSRQENQYTVKNPLTEHIKYSCPLIFDCAVSLADKLCELTGYRIGEDEIAYLALHIGGNLMIRGQEKKLLECILLFPHYYDLSDRVIKLIQEEFSQEITIAGAITGLEEIKSFDHVDLIISNIPMLCPCSAEWILVSPFFSSRDVTGIKEKIEKVKLEKKKNRLKQLLKQISCPELFCKNPNVKNQADALELMVERMRQMGYVDGAFLKQVLEREAHSSTSFDYIAVPHSLKMEALKTGMFVLLSNKPFLWGEHMVQIVLLFSVNRKDRSVFHEVFDNLVVLLLETVHADKVLDCASYEEFIDTIVQCFQ